VNEFKYILNEKGEPVAEPDLAKWGQQFEQTERRRVAREQIGEATISTVFLGLDHGWGGGPPVLWETMVFGGVLDQECDRCSGSREQAEAMHARMVARVKGKVTV
jgi:hypothetical protein